jgi:uncharacterized NAD(P)/FAD-binding protein YdhS
MSAASRVDIAILGAGFSGTALAVHLARRARPGLSVVLVDPRPDTGLGRAYDDPSGRLLLNVPAARMSLDPAAPSDFAVWWAADRGTTVDAIAADFAPRRDYGRYVAARHAEALSATPAEVARIHARAVDIEAADGGWSIALDDGGPITAAQVVLALGHGPPVLPPALDRTVLGDRLVDPLAPQALAAIDREAEVLVVGTGLTAVDALTLLDARGHRGRIVCLSRHGRWPAVHRPAPAPADPPPIEPALLAASPRRAFRHVRALAADALAAGHDWRAVIDALRPHTAPTWRAWDTAKRRQALRHLRSPWEVHRHRMAPASAEVFARLEARGQLETRAAHLVGVHRGADGRIEVAIRPRGADATAVVVADAVLVALSAAIPFAQRDDALARALLARGLVRDDPAGFGIDVDDDGRPLGASGRATPGLHAIGPLLRARDWETTAVPEIREQASALAERLLAG